MKWKLLGFFYGFTKLVLAPSILENESGIDEATTTTPITKREYLLTNMELNVLVRRAGSLNFQNTMSLHESNINTILLESKGFFDAQDKLVNETTVNFDVALSRPLKH